MGERTEGGLRADGSRGWKCEKEGLMGRGVGTLGSGKVRAGHWQVCSQAEPGRGFTCVRSNCGNGSPLPTTLCPGTGCEVGRGSIALRQPAWQVAEGLSMRKRSGPFHAPCERLSGQNAISRGSAWREPDAAAETGDHRQHNLARSTRKILGMGGGQRGREREINSGRSQCRGTGRGLH